MCTLKVDLVDEVGLVVWLLLVLLLVFDFFFWFHTIVFFSRLRSAFCVVRPGCLQYSTQQKKMENRGLGSTNLARIPESHRASCDSDIEVIYIILLFFFFFTFLILFLSFYFFSASHFTFITNHLQCQDKH